MVAGQYVKTFTEASHAIPEGMHMNADYPLKTPKIVAIGDEFVSLEGRGKIYEAPIEEGRDGREFCTIAQKSAFEVMTGGKPTKFRFHPFKDNETAAIGEAAT